MYPNPQDVLPLAARADREWYRKQAKDLVRACRAGVDAIDGWAARLTGSAGYRARLAHFARERMSRARDGRTCVLADAQFVVARAFGFRSWPAFVTHLRALEAENSAVSAFERAADAVVRGDAAVLRRLLAEHPGLALARSEREHRATLLHYVSANGVENFRQVTPRNAAEIATVLLDAGAEVDAEADVYGGGATTLGLTATSVHPARAGVQLSLLELLLARGARVDRSGAAGNGDDVVTGCLANGQPDAAAFLADRGAPLSLEGAAGIGRCADVTRLLDAGGSAIAEDRMAMALAYASAYGHPEVVEVLLDRGLAVDRQLRLYGEGHTALHLASYQAHIAVARLLLQRGAAVNIPDSTWHTTPLVWALQGWCDTRGDSGVYAAVIALLVRAGATVDERYLTGDAATADPLIAAALREPRPPG